MLSTHLKTPTYTCALYRRSPIKHLSQMLPPSHTPLAWAMHQKRSGVLLTVRAHRSQRARLEVRVCVCVTVCLPVCVAFGSKLLKPEHTGYRARLEVRASLCVTVCLPVWVELSCFTVTNLCSPRLACAHDAGLSKHSSMPAPVPEHGSRDSARPSTQELPHHPSAKR